MTDWFSSGHCKNRAHCRTCRDQTVIGESFRANTAQAWGIQIRDFPCPHGIPWAVPHVEPVPFDPSLIENKGGCGCSAPEPIAAE